ncbi:MAG: hypothetical protein J7598_03575 [Mitsuaria chitosanitabida]|uniref:hypothetical protein n=1 Tax=Roseateles chitosanitabidus TaxID=65048 RepID=UPI001B16800A|nr:hypothetical protein [Roseateles chitosanitabidus]MBO9685670.1 hypothetical protein [Roseateles chitosanitabidus]
MPSLPIQILTSQNRAAGEYQGAVSGRVDMQQATAGFQQALGLAARDEAIAKQHEAQRVHQLEADEARTQVINAQSRLQAQYQQRMTELGNSEDGLAGATATVLKDFDTWAAQEKQGASTLAKPAMDQAFARMRGEFNQHAYQAEMAYRNGKLVKDFNAGVDDDQRLVFANPAQFPDALARRKSLAESLSLPAQAKADLARGAAQQLAASAATGLAERDPQALLDRASVNDPAKFESAVKNDPMLSSMTPEALNHTLKLAKTEVERRAVEGRFDIASKTEDLQSMVLNGVEVPEGFAPTAADYTKAYGPNGAAMWQQRVGNYVAVSDSIRQMKTASAADREGLVAAAVPHSGAGFAGEQGRLQSVLQAKQLIERRIISDPAKYALETSNRVATAAYTMSKVLSDPKSSPEDRAAVVDFYARTTEAEQLRLGVDVIRDDQAGNRPRGPKVLTNEEANAISDAFRAASNGGPDAGTLIQQLELRWQKRWPQVYAQLAADNKLPAAALVIPNMPNDASRARMAQVSAMKPDELKALVKPEDLTDIKEAVLKQFDAAQQTFIAQGGSGYRTLSVIIGEAEKLATWYRANGSSVKEASAQAYTETMGHAYRFEGTYRVPNRYDAKEVQRGTAAVVDKLVREGGARVFSGDAPQIMAEDALRNRSMWISNSDESGLELRLRGADGSVYAVHDKNGAQIRMSWADLLSGASEARARDQTQEGNEEWLRRRQRELNPRRDGVIEPGNIDLNKQPMTPSLGVRIDGQQVLVPAMSDEGAVLSEQDAIAQYRRTGKHLGKFASPQASEAYLRQLRQQQGSNPAAPR